MSATVSPDRILKELMKLWVELGAEGKREAGGGVLRACSMTLLVLTEESEDINTLGETIAALMPEHPARAILVRLRGGGARTLSERVYAQCWMPFGQRRQICCEQVEIIASDDALGELPPVVLPLAVADLPVILWCRSPRLVAMPEFRAIAAMADKVVIDSAEFDAPKEALRRGDEVVGRGIMLGDLAWTRLTRWRSMLAQVFENREYLAQLPAIAKAGIWFGGNYETAAWYLGAWVSNALADAGVKAKLSVTRQEGSILRLTLEGEGFTVREWRQDGRLSISVNNLRSCTNLPDSTDYLLMREELGIVRHDPVFQRTLASAARLAYPVD